MRSSHLFLFSFLLLFSCSDYNQIVKSDNYDEKLQKAEQLYREKSFNRALVLYEQVYQRFPKDQKGELSYYKLGKSYYAIGDYYMSSYYFSNFASRYPTSRYLEDAVYHSALSSVRNSPDVSLDQEDTRIAIEELQYFVQRFPRSPKVDSCNQVMDELRFKIETKAYDAVMLYAKMEKYRAAVSAAESFLEEYPRSEYKLEMAFVLLENAYRLASRSVASKKKERLDHVIEIADKYRNDFQMSKYINRVLTISEKASEELEEADELDLYSRMVSMYERSQTASNTKKMEYLEETLKLYYTFAQRYPSSSLMGKAEEIYQRAERERSNTYSY